MPAKHCTDARSKRSAPRRAQAARTLARAPFVPGSAPRRRGAAHARRYAPTRRRASRHVPFGSDCAARDAQRRFEAVPASMKRRRGTRAGARKRCTRFSGAPRLPCAILVELLTLLDDARDRWSARCDSLGHLLLAAVLRAALQAALCAGHHRRAASCGARCRSAARRAGAAQVAHRGAAAGNGAGGRACVQFVAGLTSLASRRGSPAAGRAIRTHTPRVTPAAAFSCAVRHP